MGLWISLCLSYMSVLISMHCMYEGYAFMFICSFQTLCFHCRLGPARTSQFRGYTGSPNHKWSDRQLHEAKKPLHSKSWISYAVVCYFTLLLLLIR